MAGRCLCVLATSRKSDGTRGLVASDMRHDVTLLLLRLQMTSSSLAVHFFVLCALSAIISSPLCNDFVEKQFCGGYFCKHAMWIFGFRGPPPPRMTGDDEGQRPGPRASSRSIPPCSRSSGCRTVRPVPRRIPSLHAEAPPIP